jgi:heptosyltransferase-1
VGTVSKEILEQFRNGGTGLRILVIRLGAMGDILRTLPAVRAIKKVAPDIAIWWACDDRWSQVLEHHPDLDGILPLPRKKMDRERGGVFGWLRVARSTRDYRSLLRRNQFTLSMDFHGNLRSGLVGILAGAPLRIGYAGHQQKEGNHLLTNCHVPSGERRVSRMVRNLSLISQVGIQGRTQLDAGLPVLPGPDREAEKIVASLLTAGPPYVLISPGVSAAQAYKKPPAELLAAAAIALQRRGIGVLVTWGPGEKPDAEKVAELSGHAAIVVPQVDLPVLFHLIRRAILFIGGDTGPLHVACAVGTPVLGIYGPTDPVVNAPWTEINETVFPPAREYTGIKKIDRDAGGFEGLSVQQVQDALSRLLHQIGV